MRVYGDMALHDGGGVRRWLMGFCCLALSHVVLAHKTGPGSFSTPDPEFRSASIHLLQDRGSFHSLFSGRRRTARIRSSKEDHGTHYFLSTSAIPLGRRTGYYKNTLVTLNSFAYGITNHLAISGGVDLFSVISSRVRSARWYSRVQLSGSLGDNVHVGAQAFYAALPLPYGGEQTMELDTPPGFGSGMGMITLGNEVHQLTLTGGAVYDSVAGKARSLFGGAGMARVAPNVAVVTEHWWFPNESLDYTMHSLGIRILGDHLALDIGLAYDRELAVRVLPFGLPFVSGILNF